MRTSFSKIAAIVGIIFIAYLGFAQSGNNAVKIQAPLFGDLSSYSHPISTQVPLAQRFFNQGLVLFYGFEWNESIRSFRESARLDPNCAMCYWGIALALGSKINAPRSGYEYQEAKTAIEKALSLKDKTTPIEKAYIEGLALRFQHKPQKVVAKTSVFSCHISSASFDTSSKEEILNYAHAMKAIAKQYPSENDAKALYTFGIFDVIKWNFWDPNGVINKLTPTIIQTLQTILKSDPYHAGANHYYVHVMESSKTPEKALENADRLKTLVPGSEHLIHMPGHIYFRTGRYHDCSLSNMEAIKTFNKYNKTCRDQGFEPEINYLYLHNFDFLRTTAVMEGRKHLAFSAVHKMLQSPFPEWLAQQPALQWFIPMPYYMETRFGEWDAVLKEPKPDEKYVYAIGMWRYARGLAFLHNQKIKNAERESQELHKIVQAGPTNQNLQKDGIELLKIANNVLKAGLADQAGDGELMIKYIQTDVKVQLYMGYHEQPDWYFPVKEVLAGAYLKWGKAKEAKAMYEEDLQDYPKNGWALYGLAKSLRALGENRKAAAVDQAFKEAWRYADIPAPVSLLPEKK
ncbi:MAG: tetratricopeptide repeat protein [Legionellaceae bacterium]|nr:tetratricopeptide repeat protein [Legionellaceae bacterium]